MPAELTEEFIRERLRREYRPGAIAARDAVEELDADADLKCAAVLIPLIRWREAWHLVLTRRTQTVEHHKGQVSFPGGGCDLGDATPEATALREAEEEIGVKPQDVRLLGRLNDYLTITRYRVTPVVGVMPWPYSLRLEPAEVGRVFTLPLDWVADPDNWDEQNMTPDGVRRPFPVIRYHLYDGEMLWGASARMTHNLLQVLGLK
jgi:8-oxo-dGTP pyrophosphatase MutT (NUDIX family)